MMTSFAEAMARRRAMASGEIWASEIVPGALWLGAGRDAANLSQLRVHAITHVLNVADDVPCFHEGEPGLSYLQLGVADFGADEGISRVFPRAVAFARQAFALDAEGPGEGGRCGEGRGEIGAASLATVADDAALPPPPPGRLLVHCANGSNRSATVVVALLVAIGLPTTLPMTPSTLADSWELAEARCGAAFAPLRDNRAELLAYDCEQRAARGRGEPPSMCEAPGGGRLVRITARIPTATEPAAVVHPHASYAASATTAFPSLTMVRCDGI